MFPDPLTSLIVFYATIVLFTVIGLWASKTQITDKDTFLTARKSQEWIGLGTNFFAAGLGVWAFFALPQVGSSTGLLGVFGYSFSMIVPLLALGWFGPILREKVPDGVTITEFVMARFGRAAHFLTNIIAILYMSVFLISELTALGFLLEVFHINILVAQIVVCISTALYSCIGGMKASLLTDKFQGWIVILLMAIVTFAFGFNVRLKEEHMQDTELLKPSRIAYESLYTLTVANLSANIFHQGYWQRVYSAKDNKSLVKASAFASFLSFPVFFLIGLTGVLAVWSGLSDVDDPLAFFHITSTLPAWVNAVVLILATAFVASSVDTLQNAIVATFVNDVFLNKVSLTVARGFAVLINIPVLLIAALKYDVLSLFLIADLAAAFIVCPVLFGLIYGRIRMPPSPECKVTNAKTLPQHEPAKSPSFDDSCSKIHLPNGFDFCMGVIGGITSVVAFGTVFHGGDIQQGFFLLTLPHGLNMPGESLGAFVAAPVGSMLFFVIAWGIRMFLYRLFPRLRQFKDSWHLFHGTKC